MALRICVSKPETSYASSVGVGCPGLLTGGDESDCACALLALPAFLCSEELTVKLREGWDVHDGVAILCTALEDGVSRECVGCC
jgi:hypothetical protein